MRNPDQLYYPCQEKLKNKRKLLKAKNLIFILLTSLLMNGCLFTSSFNSNQPDQIKTVIQVEGTPTNIYISSQPPDDQRNATLPVEETDEDGQRPQYDFQIIVDYEKHNIEVSETIVYVNKTGTEISLIPLLIPPAHYSQAVTVKKFLSLPHATLLQHDPENEIYTIDLDENLKNGSTINIKIDFSINIPRQEGPFGYTDLQTNLWNWYPFIPTQGRNNDWLINKFSPFGEYIVNEKSDFTATVKTKSDIDLIIVGSGEVIEKDEILIFSHVNARDFSLSLSPYFKIITQNLGEITINGYVLPEHEAAGGELVRNTMAAMIYYTSLYDMAYPHSTLNVVEADFPDGMESDGMYFLSKDYLDAYDGSHRNYMTILSAHETAHQWFYGIVGNDQANEPWLDEALCTLSEILYFEEFFPDDVNWWWDYRVNSYNPEGKVDITIYEAQSLRSYINSVYLQGARFLDELRTSIGGEYFITAMKNYVRENQNQIAFSDEFFSEFELLDLSTIRSKYFSR